MLRWLAAGLWGGLSAVLIVLMVAGQTFTGVGELAFVGAGLVLAVLIGAGGLLGLIGATLGAGLAGLLTFVLLGLHSYFPGSGAAWAIVATATLTLTSGLAAREMWKARAHPS